MTNTTVIFLHSFIPHDLNVAASQRPCLNENSAPPAASSAAKPPAKQEKSSGGGMMAGMASTMAQGFAFGTGSSIAHR